MSVIPSNQTTNSKLENTPGDLPDNEHDKKRMQPEEVILDLPDVSDIPGQENILPPRFEEMADTTISSDDEEGLSVFGNEDTLDSDEATGSDAVMGNEADVSLWENTLLQNENDTMYEDEKNLQRAALDNTDDDGDLLNEADDVTGDDLDTSGSDEDDAMENIGGEDEENNSYSLGDNDTSEETT